MYVFINFIPSTGSDYVKRYGGHRNNQTGKVDPSCLCSVGDQSDVCQIKCM